MERLTQVVPLVTSLGQHEEIEYALDADGQGQRHEEASRRRAPQ